MAKKLQEKIDAVIDLYFNGESKEALISIEVLIRDHPGEVMLLNIQGACVVELGQLNKAIKSYEKVRTDLVPSSYQVNILRMLS